MIYRKIDKEGYFIEDVVWEPKLDEDGKPTEEMPEDLIAEELPHDMALHRPKWDGQEWVDDPTDAQKAEMLEATKSRKRDEITKEKKRRQLANVTVRDIEWFGGRESGQKYDESFRLAKMLGKDKGQFLSASRGMVEVDETLATEIIAAIGVATYQAWAEAQQYLAQVEAALTIEEVNQIKWEENK